METAPKAEQIIYKKSALHIRIWKQDLFIMTFNKSVLWFGTESNLDHLFCLFQQQKVQGFIQFRAGLQQLNG